MYLLTISLYLIHLPLFCTASPYKHENSVRGISIADPELANPTHPILPLKADRPEVNPFANGLPTAPRVCTDLFNPTTKCQRALSEQDEGLIAFGGGSLKFQDQACSAEHRMRLETAAWDAYTLSVSGAKYPATGDKMAVWRAYVGPDFSDQQDRMINNLNRVADFRHTKKFDILISCKDKKNLCSKSVNDKPVAAYAYTYRGWLGDYHYITLCDIFFGLSSLEETTEWIEEQLQRGNTEYAENSIWQKNMGQFFLHEMMHLDSVGDPHIDDEYVDPDGIGKKAYGPQYVYKLAQRSLTAGGGATRGSTNADTYAWLANSLYFFELTKYFPKPPKYKSQEASDNNEDDKYPILMNLGDFDRDSATEREFQIRVDKESKGFE